MGDKIESRRRLRMVLYFFMYLFHHKHLVYNYSANGETGELSK